MKTTLEKGSVSGVIPKIGVPCGGTLLDAVPDSECDDGRQSQQRQRYSEMIGQLIGWSAPGAAPDSELGILPTRIAVEAASRILPNLFQSDAQYFETGRMAANGDGGITFQAEQGDLTVLLSIEEDGQAELIRCRDGRVIDVKSIETVSQTIRR